MSSRRSAALAGLALALAVAGCGRVGSSGGREACTLIGCQNENVVTVTVDQPGERPLEACVGAACSPPGEVLSVVDVPLGDVAEVVVRVAGGGAEVARIRATPTRARPNGGSCPPECRAVRLRLTVEDQLVPA